MKRTNLPSRFPVCRLLARRHEAFRALTITNTRTTTTSTRTPFYGTPRPTFSSSSSSSSLLFLPPTVQVAVSSAVAAFQDPTRADAVAALGEVTGHFALSAMHKTMMEDPVGRAILQDRPIVSQATVPNDNEDDSTFGHGYLQFMKLHGFDPNDRDPVRYMDDTPELAYVMLRYRQCHDFWHVLTGLPPTVVGELALKWLELLQMGLPVAALAVTAGSFTLTAPERHLLHQHYLPWAIRMSRQSKYLLNVYYEKEWETSLDELRKRIKIEAAPSIVE